MIYIIPLESHAGLAVGAQCTSCQRHHLQPQHAVAVAALSVGKVPAYPAFRPALSRIAWLRVEQYPNRILVWGPFVQYHFHTCSFSYNEN